MKFSEAAEQKAADDPLDTCDLSLLTPHQRMVIEWRRKRLSPAQIAEQAGIKVGGVYMAVTGARRRLGIPLDMLRAPGSRIQREASAPPPPPRAPKVDPFVGVDLSPLPKRQQVIVGKRLEGKCIKDIAAEMGRHPQTINNALHRAKVRLGLATRVRWTPRASAPPQAPLSDEAAALLARGMEDARAGRVSEVPPEVFDEPPAPPPISLVPALTPANDGAEDFDDEPAPALAVLRRPGTVDRRTISGDRLSREEKRAAALIVYPDDQGRPRTRGDCEGGPRPCPWISCAHHLYLDVEKSGSLKVNFPHLEVWEMKESCALDVADRGPVTLEETGACLNVTRERARQIETNGLRQLKRSRKCPTREFIVG